MKNDPWFGNQPNPQMGGQFMVDPNSNQGRNMFPYSMPNHQVSPLGHGGMMPFQMRPPVSGQPPFNMDSGRQGGMQGGMPGMAQLNYGGMPQFNPSQPMPKPYRDGGDPMNVSEVGVYCELIA
jgi:hypothetical protein